MTPEEIRANGRRLFQSRQYAEAIPLLKSATDTFPNDEEIWQELVMAAMHHGQHEDASEFTKLAIRHHPRSHWLWRALGSQLLAAGRLDDAEKALDNSRTLSPDAPWLWRYFIKLHQQRQDYKKESEAWEKLGELENLTAKDLNNFGIACHNWGDYAKAVELYRQSATADPHDATPIFNMGLVFDRPEMSQGVDASDAYRRALAINPQYEKAQKSLETTKQKWLTLAPLALAEAGHLLRAEEIFQFYANPFEVFSMEPDDAVSKLDVKTIQRAKKRLLGEIELNGGRVEWLENHEIDKARALALENELLDEKKQGFHRLIFENKQLLRFLTRGSIEHFLYSEEYFPKETLHSLELESPFRSFLSRPFARQYNLVLSRSIERRALASIEALFGGRRWVAPEDDDICFEGALKHIGEVISQFKELEDQGKKQKIDLSKIKNLLLEKRVVELFNLLPGHFAFQQARHQIVSHLRALAIDCHNLHSDLEMSAQILGFCKQFRLQDADLSKRLANDSQMLDKLLSENRTHTFSALIRKGLTVQIAESGITYGEDSILAAEIEAIRWGIYVRKVNGVETEHSYVLAVNDSSGYLEIYWDRRGFVGKVKSFFRKEGVHVPISQLSSAEQKPYFDKMIDAVLHFLVPPLISKLVQRLQNGGTVSIGPCALTQSGIAFSIGVLFRKIHLVPWRHAEIKIRNGEVRVSDRRNQSLHVSTPVRRTDNAIILPRLCDIMCVQSPVEPEDKDDTASVPSHKKQTVKSRKGWLLLIVIPLAFFLFRACSPHGHANANSNVKPDDDSILPSDRSPAPAVSQPATPSYVVSSRVAADLDQDRRAITDEKIRANDMEKRLDNLDGDIKRERANLDHNSQSAIDAFNEKVNAYNILVKQMQAEDRLVDQMIDDYNAKLRNFGSQY